MSDFAKTLCNIWHTIFMGEKIFNSYVMNF
jgi:hypothetical protein